MLCEPINIYDNQKIMELWKRKSQDAKIIGIMGLSIINNVTDKAFYRFCYTIKSF
jgi:hypothetical protein